MRMNRRAFVKKSLVLTGIMSMPELIPSSVLGREGQTAPSERITMGVIGCGAHAGWNINLMLRNKGQQIIALCDVDETHKAAKKKMVENWYTKQNGRPYEVAMFHDFRDLLRRKDIDAVDIITQDQWHVLMAVTAMKSGKHVICEKPTLTTEESRILVETQKKTGRVFLTASQNRTVDTNQFLTNVVRNEVIGKLRNIKVLLPYRKKSREKRSFEPCPVPKTLDFERWTGPAKLLPYTPAISHISWRHNLAYSGGVLPDWGAHYINLALWAMDADLTPPQVVFGNRDDENPMRRWYYPDPSEVWDTTDGFDFTARFNNGVNMRVFSDKTPGIKFEGESGWILAKGSSLYSSELTASDESILKWRPAADDIDVGRDLRHCMVSRTDKNGLPGIKGGEHVHFTHCIKTGQTPYYTAAMGANTDLISAMAQVSMMVFDGAPVQWDETRGCMTGCDEKRANESLFVHRLQRDPWTFGHVDSWIG